MDNTWLTLREVAGYIRVSPRTVQRYISGHGLKAHRMPTGSIRIRQIDVDSWIIYSKSFSKLTRPQKEMIFEARDS